MSSAAYSVMRRMGGALAGSAFLRDFLPGGEVAVVEGSPFSATAAAVDVDPFEVQAFCWKASSLALVRLMGFAASGTVVALPFPVRVVALDAGAGAWVGLNSRIESLGDVTLVRPSNWA